MANIFEVTDLVAKEALEVAHEKLTFLGTVNRQYESEYRGDPKHGATLRIKSPRRFSVRQGSRIMDVQDVDEDSTTLTVATQDGVDMRFNSAELVQATASPDQFERFAKENIEPAISQLVSYIEGTHLATATKAVYNIAGTAGTAPADLSSLGLARAKINQGLAPKSNRHVQMDSVIMTGLVNGLRLTVSPADQTAEAYREGFISRTAMATLWENERCYAHTNAADVAGEIDEQAATNFVEGATTIHIDGLGTAVTAGSIFTWEGVYACHPETKTAYAHLQQFTVVGTPTIANNEGDITFSPAIYTTGAKKNVSTSTGADLTWTAAGQDGKDITFFGNASTTYRHSLMYQSDAFVFVTAPLPIMDDAAKCVQRMKDNLSVRVWTASDIRNDELLMRLDILHGFATVRPEWASRITS